MIRRADDYLGERLLEIDRHPGPYQDAALRFAQHTLAAFREIGLLSDADADSWDSRLARAAEDPIDRPRQSAEAGAAAHRYLERLVADLAADPEHDLMAHARIDGGIRALAEVGALSEREAADWRERAFPPPPDVARLPPCEKTHVSHVVQGTGEPIDGLLVTLVELYADGVTVNWHEQPARLGERAMRRVRDLLGEDSADLAQPSLNDDVGTSYAFCGGSAGHGTGRRAAIGHSDFAPAPPLGARALIFESLGRQIRVALDA